MPEIARVDDSGNIIAVESCSAQDHKTCPIARTVQLPENHDMHARAKGYRWDFVRQCFLPLSAEPLDAAERDTSELLEGIVETIEAVEQKLKLELPKRMKRALKAYRRHTPKRPGIELEIVDGEAVEQ